MLLSESLIEGVMPLGTLQGETTALSNVVDLTQGFRPIIVAIEYADSQKILVGFRIWNWGAWYLIEQEACWFEESGFPALDVDDVDLAQARVIAVQVIADVIGESIMENDDYRPTEWN